ncbi:lambda-exonuclease family protein [Pyramidobacter sp.]|uniref:YqaJ viral recombinase family nuclease n=1 Tax=Pyramidobacter sp. TaxID=1943581 RepID=UPI00332A8BAA
MTAIRLCATADMSSEEWLAARTRGIGGSDAAKVFGLVPYPDATPYALWLEKTGQIPLRESESEAAHFGHVLEDIVASEFERRSEETYGAKIALRRSNYMWRHPEYPWMIANFDRAVVGNPRAGFEAKTANTFMADEWRGDSVPDAYYVQCQHYMAVMGWDLVYIACLLGGQKFVTKPVLRSDDFIAAMIERERAFWEDNVLKNAPPPMTAADDPARYYPAQTFPDLIPATNEAHVLAEEYAEVKKTLKILEDQEDMLRNELTMLIGEHAGIEGVCTWKQNKSSKKTDWQGLAIELGASTEQIERYTTEKPGARVLRLLSAKQKGVA